MVSLGQWPPHHRQAQGPPAAARVQSWSATMHAVRAAVEAHADLIAEELNLKAVATSDDEQAHAHLSAKPNFRVLGPRFGPRMKEAARRHRGARRRRHRRHHRRRHGRRPRRAPGTRRPDRGARASPGRRGGLRRTPVGGPRYHAHRRARTGGPGPRGGQGDPGPAQGRTASMCPTGSPSAGRPPTKSSPLPSRPTPHGSRERSWPTAIEPGTTPAAARQDVIGIRSDRGGRAGLARPVSR